MADYGVIKPYGTRIHEHFHYALATTLGNLVNMFYRVKRPYQVHVNRETDRTFVSTIKSLSYICTCSFMKFDSVRYRQSSKCFRLSYSNTN